MSKILCPRCGGKGQFWDAEYDKWFSCDHKSLADGHWFKTRKPAPADVPAPDLLPLLREAREALAYGVDSDAVHELLLARLDEALRGEGEEGK